MAYQTESDLGIIEQVKNELEDANRRMADIDRAIEFDLSFGLDLDHYENESSFDERSLHRIMPRDPGGFRIWRYKTALGLKRFPVRVEARPSVPGTPPQMVEAMRRRIESVVTDPDKNYSDARRRMFGGALAARVWGMRLCYDGDLYFDSLDPRCVRWCDGFLHPQHPKNPWVHFVMRLPIERVRYMKNWNVPDDLAPDDGYDQPRKDNSATNPGERTDARGSLVTVVMRYSRFEDATTRTKRESALPLDHQMQYMACPSCGWTSPPQAEEVQPYPESGPCPTCGADAGLVTHAPHYDDGLKYSGGKRLVICFPFSNSKTPAYDGDWEFDYPTFPLAWLVAYPFPHKPNGQSDTSVLKTPTLAKNALIRLTYETLIRSQPYWRIPSFGLNNVYGMPFAFQPQDGNIMVGDFMPGTVELLQGQGPNPSIFSAWDRLDAIFRTNESTSEVALSPSQLSEAKVGAIDLYTETGNVPLDDHGELLYEAETRLLSCVEAAVRQMPSVDVPYQDNGGAWQFQRAGGPSMSPVKVRVAAGHSLDDMDKDEIAAYMALVQMPPEVRAGYAALKHIDPSVLQMIPPPPPQGMATPNGMGAPNNAPPQPPVAAPPMNGVPNG